MTKKNEDYDHYTRWSYDEFRIKQPHIETEGLWVKNDFYYIKCKDLTVKPINDDELSIEEHFNRKIKAIGAPVMLVDKLPEEVTRVKDRSLQEVIQLTGVPLNQIDFDNQLSMLLPKDFPPYKFYLKQGEAWTLEVGRFLTNEEKQTFRNCLYSLQGHSIDKYFKVIVNTKISPMIKTDKTNNLDILPIRTLSSNISSVLKRQLEKDEQLWIDYRLPILATEDFTDKDFTTPWNQNGSSCLIDVSVYSAHNIRNYLSMYKNIILVAPIHQEHQKVLSSLGVSQSELIELIKIGRIKLLLPHSIERYNLRFLEEVADTGQNNMMFSRHLALKTISDSRKRNPFLYPTLEIEDKQQLLFHFYKLADYIQDKKAQDCIKALALELSRIWSDADIMLATRGAMGTAALGLAPIISAIFKSQTGHDYSFELLTSSMAVEWAGAMKSTLCPLGASSTIKNTELLSNIYSGVQQDQKMELMSSPNIVLEGILTIAKEVPVLELAKTFNGADIDRFHSMIQHLHQHYRPEEMNTIIDEFNKSVKAFERKKNRTASWDVKGVIVEGATHLSNATIPFAGVLMNILGRSLENFGEKSTRVGEFLDKAQASLYKTTPEAILVSRMRDQIKDKI